MKKLWDWFMALPLDVHALIASALLLIFYIAYMWSVSHG